MMYSLGFLLAVSFTINIVMVWYIRQLLSNMRKFEIFMRRFRNLTLDYKEALEKVYNMDLFYGEPILEQMMKNTNIVIENYNTLGDELNDLLGSIEEEPHEEI